jgi:hypothetical protein
MTDTQRAGSPHLKPHMEREVKMDETITSEIEDEPPFDIIFQEKFHKAMLSIVEAQEYISALKCFRAAYEYRKTFSWLAESTEPADIIHQDGLSYALQTALINYIVLDPKTLEAEIHLAAVKGLVEEETVHVDSAWLSKLTSATTATIKEAFNLERFENHLIHAQVDIASSDLEPLKQHIAGALISYYKRRKIGTAPDPF